MLVLYSIILIEKCVPSIAQLEERGTVKETLCDPEVTGSIPVRRIFFLAERLLPHLATDSKQISLISPFLTPNLFSMADIQTVTQDDRPLFTCLSCSIAFLTAEEQRTTLFHSLTQTELIASRGSLSLRPPQV